MPVLVMHGDDDAEQLRRWLATMAAAPAERRAKGNKPQYRPEPTTDEEIRQRRE